MSGSKKVRIVFGIALATFLLLDYLRTDGKFSTMSFIIIIILSFGGILSDLYLKNGENRKI